MPSAPSFLPRLDPALCPRLETPDETLPEAEDEPDLDTWGRPALEDEASLDPLEDSIEDSFEGSLEDDSLDISASFDFSGSLEPETSLEPDASLEPDMSLEPEGSPGFVKSLEPEGEVSCKLPPDDEDELLELFEPFLSTASVFLSALPLPLFLGSWA